MDFKNKFAISRADAKKILMDNGVWNLLVTLDNKELEVIPEDLARLFVGIRTNMPGHVLEFGSGFSTVVMAKALELNSKGKVKTKNKHVSFPKLFSIETSKEWMNNTQEKINKAGLQKFVELCYSECSIDKYNGQLCSYYDSLPDISPDFIYLDGPDPTTVKDNIKGLTFKHPRKVMAADLLLYESTILPGTVIMVDGRIHNVWFLERMFTRKYEKSIVNTWSVFKLIN